MYDVRTVKLIRSKTLAIENGLMQCKNDSNTFAMEFLEFDNRTYQIYQILIVSSQYNSFGFNIQCIVYCTQYQPDINSERTKSRRIDGFPSNCQHITNCCAFRVSFFRQAALKCTAWPLVDGVFFKIHLIRENRTIPFETKHLTYIRVLLLFIFFYNMCG